jgi:hypothetical protein
MSVNSSRKASIKNGDSWICWHVTLVTFFAQNATTRAFLPSLSLIDIQKSMASAWEKAWCTCFFGFWGDIE